MTSDTDLDSISLSVLDRYKIQTGLSRNDLLSIQNQLTSFLKQQPELKQIRHKLYNIFFKLHHSANSLDILDEHDNYYESMSILMNYFMDLEISALNDPGSDESNWDVFNRIYSFLNFYLNCSELNIVKTFVYYFIRDNKIMDLKDDPILTPLFCTIFEKLFFKPYKTNRPKGNELEFLSYLLIFKIWHFVCRTAEEKDKIEQLIPLLYKFDTSLSSFIISKKYITHNYYDNTSYTINNIKERIIRILKTDKSAIESLKQTESLTITPYFKSHCSYTVPIKLLDDLTKKSEDILVESSDEAESSFKKPQLLTSNYSEATTIQVLTPENSRNLSGISANTFPSYCSSTNHVEENISGVSTVQLHYPDEDEHHDLSDDTTTISVLNLDSAIAKCPSNSSFFTAANTQRSSLSVSDTSTTYLSCPSSTSLAENVSQTQSEKMSKIISPNSASSSPRLMNFPKINNGKSHIRIIERKDYIKKVHSRGRTFSMLRDESLKQNAQKRSIKSLENGWKEIKQCCVRIKRLDDFEIEALKNKDLPLKYFSRIYSDKTSNDEQMSENSIDLNDSNISIEILEETLGSRAYLYCREVQKTLSKNGRKRAKSCYSY